MVRLVLAGALLAGGISLATATETFHLPTANRALFEKDGEEKFFVGTTGKPWSSGTFGCVRSGGWQMHEGLDVRCWHRDKKGEPTDSVLATANGTVAYINRKAGLSNYGNYIVLRHSIDGLELYSLYAHLSAAREGLAVGAKVKAGEQIAVMGRTSNTRERISKERAHVHFELDFLVNERFSGWYKKNFPGQRDDHGQWNGQNMIGLDPRTTLISAHEFGDRFNLLGWVQRQTELCRVIVRDTSFPWLKRYAPLVRSNSFAEKNGIAGYELALNFNGLPFQVIPRSAGEIKSKAKYSLVSVNETEYEKNPCRRLVTKRNGHWELASAGTRLLDLLTY
ncbi:MAG: M23 family metallopeptidase [Verrucomicrobiota bacterium]